MYADDTVLYIHAKNKQQAAYKLTAAMVLVSDWLGNSCLPSFSHGNLQRLNNKVVSVFRYLGIILDLNLSIKKHVKKVANAIKFNLANLDI